MPAPVSKIKICIISQNKIFYIDVGKIIHLESDNNYTKIFYQKFEGSIATLFCSKNIGHYEQILDTDLFLRVHNRHLINLTYIFMFDKINNRIELIGGEVIEVSLRRRAGIIKKINQFITATMLYCSFFHLDLNLYIDILM